MTSRPQRVMLLLLGNVVFLVAIIFLLLPVLSTLALHRGLPDYIHRQHDLQFEMVYASREFGPGSMHEIYFGEFLLGIFLCGLHLGRRP